ncbi:bacteriohemerythrin [Campylobacter coli]|uniref:bacteriohemerythrin n=2 Tax=Campylobacter coli TaxID=195 RepID=UPI00069B149D|nr:bacteriohemerythrin [Campylobacter coli]EAI9679523.1 bacteriohemerythrin [Campylobacter coli]EAJ6799590.1 bacteriohemerythrin [Campylobacter coli]EAK4064816.1 bacteriohemerythrin [Campylobacter coli]EAK6195460.1 bacteriohemerythrin [Campylobacter coli]EAL1832201.1 bacteriohemerythrin [Campylobacter coli]
MLPKWDKIYSVHNGKIDNQHKKLFELAAKVEHIFDKPVHRDEIKALLTDFFNYMKYHFDDEEKYMQFICYPDFERHRQIHKEIIQSMIKIIQNIKTTNDLKEKLYIMVKKWLLEHILMKI